MTDSADALARPDGSLPPGSRPISGPRPARTPRIRLRGRDLQFPWGRLRTWEGGSGVPLLAVHGLGGSGRYWEGLASAVGNGFTVIAPDHAGFGHSDKPVLTYDRAFHLDNLEALIDDVAHDRPVTLVGHSMGGIIAALWAARHPERVSALALVATPFPAGQMSGREGRTRSSDERLFTRGMYRTFQTLWPLLTLPYFSRTYPRAVLDDYMRHTLPSYWGTAHTFLWDADVADELSGLRAMKAPTLILNATDDKRVSERAADRWAALLPHADREVTTGGHQLLLRQRFEPLATWLRASVE